MAVNKIKKLLQLWLVLSGSACLGADASHIIDNYKRETFGLMDLLASLQKNSGALSESIESLSKDFATNTKSLDLAIIDAILTLHSEWGKIISKQIEALDKLVGNLQQQISTLVAYNDAKDEKERYFANFTRSQID